MLEQASRRTTRVKVKVEPVSFDGRRSTLVAAVACALAACAKTTPAALSPEGARVRVSQASAVEGCELVGNFGSGLGARSVWPPWAANQVRNVAAMGGATDVVLDVTSRGDTVGKGYVCPSSPAPVAPPPASTPPSVPPVPTPPQ